MPKAAACAISSATSPRPSSDSRKAITSLALMSSVVATMRAKSSGSPTERPSVK